VTLDQLVKIMPYARKRAGDFLGPLNAAMVEFDINTPARQASFVAQVGHESGQLQYVREIASGDAYEGRKDLGNTQPGDGRRFRGRGLIQITGRANYAACGAALGLGLLSKPELLEQPVNACRSAGWFWKSRGLNELADAGDQVRITKRINGGTNGLADRLALFEVARKVLS
jgi:putative chitinase